jgi:hypothetical protein
LALRVPQEQLGLVDLEDPQTSPDTGALRAAARA